MLRARRNLETARSNVEQLTSFARDVRNRLGQGLAIRSDDLAAQVSLANAQLSEIQARTSLESAWATYNRYLCRPLDQPAELEEISQLPTENDFWERMAAQVVANRAEFAGQNSPEVRDLTIRAFQLRPELAGLAEQARALTPRPTPPGPTSGPRSRSPAASSSLEPRTSSRKATAWPASS